jgi:hypothetical protein
MSAGSRVGSNRDKILNYNPPTPKYTVEPFNAIEVFALSL